MRVLVVDDNAVAAESVLRDLRRVGYAVDHVETREAALRSCDRADLVLLDLGLSGCDALAVCREIRARCDVPIIAFTDQRDELECVLGLKAGSDDCLVKPYGFRELIARIEAVMRRARPRPRPPAALTRAGLRIDPETREVRVGGEPVSLTRKEFDLLWALASRGDGVVSREELMSAVWDEPSTQPGRTIDTHVYSLRAKLGGDWIITVRGVGYRLGDGGEGFRG
ncbi:response regulator transcription factor [Nonomuraea candida]|uniref:response regulator transcription factor n=1 Tax=Nonomuraea candida TaxID=359159 RepID=UPI000693CDC1|nr:response regulator transcription factor [Nonomuraea candida]